MCIADLTIGANAAAELPVIESSKNYCGPCSPFGFPYGEPGENCSMCGDPMVLTTEQVAATRLFRNRSALARQGRGIAW